mgnify:CR=1 FL=1
MPRIIKFNWANKNGEAVRFLEERVGMIHNKLFMRYLRE